VIALPHAAPLPRRAGSPPALLLLSLLLWLAVGLAAPRASAQDEGAGPSAHRLGAGDVVEVAVAGIPDLTYRAAVEAGGLLALPVGDPVEAAGLTLDELRARIREGIAGRVVQRQGSGGAVPVTVPPGQVAVQVVEWRPVYLMGDVGRSGAQAYRPGMTARQAVAEGGGYALVPITGRPPALEATQIMGRIGGLEAALARELARNDRLRAEAGFERRGAEGPRRASAVAERFERIEGAHATAIDEDIATNLDHLEGLIELVGVQRDRLTETRAQEEIAVQGDRDEVARLEGLADQGLTALPRLVEARRSLTNSAGRLLDTTIELGNLERDERNLERDIDDLSNERRIAYLGELSQSEVTLRQIASELDAARRQLGLVGSLPTELPGSPEDHVTVHLSRVVDGAERSFEAGLDTLLRPGDVIRVELDQALGGL
jgi:polysaccharide export outer membrane protein